LKPGNEDLKTIWDVLTNPMEKQNRCWDLKYKIYPNKKLLSDTYILVDKRKTNRLVPYNY